MANRLFVAPRPRSVIPRGQRILDGLAGGMSIT